MYTDKPGAVDQKDQQLETMNVSFILTILVPPVVYYFVV